MKVTVISELVQKRQIALQSTIEAADSQLYYERAKIADKDQKPNRENTIRTFIEHCTDHHNANKYFRQCMYFLERANDQNNEVLAKDILNIFSSQVLPYVEDIDMVSGVIGRYHLTESQADTILESVEQYKVADRIINNHNFISKRFNIESLFSGSNHGRQINLENAILKCCTMMDTYDTTPAAKMNLALEEIIYGLEKNRLGYDIKMVVETVTKYFLHRESVITETDYISYRTVLENSPLVDEKDCEKVSYFTKFYDSSDVIRQNIHKFSANPVKTKEGFIDTINTIFTVARPIEITNFMKEILYYIRIYMVSYSDYFDMDYIKSIINIIVEKIEVMALENCLLDRSMVEFIYSCFQEEIKAIDVYCYDMDDLPDHSDRLFELKRILINCSESIKKILEVVYTNYNIDEMQKVHQEACANPSISLNEFKIFKFDNLLRIAHDIDQNLKKRGQKFMNKVSSKLKKIKSNLLEEVDITRCINQADRFDFCISKYEILEGTDLTELHREASSLCEDININCHLPEFAHLYYTITDGLEFHLEYGQTITLTEEEKELVESSISWEDMTRFVVYEEAREQLEDYQMTFDIIGMAHENSAQISLEQFKTFMEVAAYTNRFTNDVIFDLVDNYNKTHPELNCLERSRLIDESSKWTNVEVTDDIVTEALLLSASLLESDNQKEKINKEKQQQNKEKDPAALKRQSILDRIKGNNQKKEPEKDTKKSEEKEKKGNPFAGVNLNNLKIYAAGLKKKVKDMSAKEKEFSRNLDTSVNRLHKAMKDALVSDRREAIIKGSVIPSFSKSIKTLIAVAGIGIINPGLAVITVIGGFALSKKLTRQERLLLLDELETEMEVIDKEIELAQSRNQIKRYRTLLRYKKECQRQYQRIRYNVRIGKDMMPSSTAGIKDSNN